MLLGTGCISPSGHWVEPADRTMILCPIELLAEDGNTYNESIFFCIQVVQERCGGTQSRGCSSQGPPTTVSLCGTSEAAKDEHCSCRGISKLQSVATFRHGIPVCCHSAFCQRCGNFKVSSQNGMLICEQFFRNKTPRPCFYPFQSSVYVQYTL